MDEAAPSSVRQHRDRKRHIAWGCEPPDRHAGDIGVCMAARCLVSYIGLDPAWANSIHPHTSPAPFRREGSRQADQSMLVSRLALAKDMP